MSAAATVSAVTCGAIPAPAQGGRRYGKPRSKDPLDPEERERSIEKRTKRKQAKAQAKAEAGRKLKHGKIRARIAKLKHKLRFW